MNYKSLLYELQQGNNNGSYIPDAVAINVPSNASLYNVDLKTRTIEAPQYLSVLNEHRAETVYFLVDRYYDNMDLSQTVCVIYFVTKDGKGYIYYVPFCDVTTFYGKMIIPWNISGAATAFEGKVKYNLSFYLMENIPDINNYDLFDWANAKFKYRLTTKPAESEVLHGLPLETVANDADFGFSLENLNQTHTLLASIQDKINTAYEAIEDSIVYWTDV